MSSKSKYQTLKEIDELNNIDFSDSDDDEELINFSDKQDNATKQYSMQKIQYNNGDSNSDSDNENDEELINNIGIMEQHQEEQIQNVGNVGNEELEFQRQLEEAMKISMDDFNNNKSNIERDLEDNFGTNLSSSDIVINNNTNNNTNNTNKKKEKRNVMFLATFPMAMYYDYDNYKSLDKEESNYCIASNKILEELFNNEEGNNNYSNITIKLKIFKNNMNTGLCITPYEFVIDDNVYIPHKIFEKLGIQPGDYLCYRF